MYLIFCFAFYNPILFCLLITDKDINVNTPIIGFVITPAIKDIIVIILV